MIFGGAVKNFTVQLATFIQDYSLISRTFCAREFIRVSACYERKQGRASSAPLARNRRDHVESRRNLVSDGGDKTVVARLECRQFLLSYNCKLREKCYPYVKNEYFFVCENFFVCHVKSILIILVPKKLHGIPALKKIKLTCWTKLRKVELSTSKRKRELSVSKERLNEELCINWKQY